MEEEYQPREIEVMNLIKVKRGARVLDIGCGKGRILNSLESCEKYCVDIIPRKLHGVKSYVADLNKEKLPFKENMFDWVICTEVIEHLSTPDNLLSEIHRVLKPKGILVLSTPNLVSWVNRIKLLFGIKPGNLDTSFKIISPGHIRVYTPGMLKELLGIHDLRLIKILGAGPSSKSNKIRKTIEKIPDIASYLILEAEAIKK